MIYSANYSSPLGQLTIASDGKSITGLWIEQQKHIPRDLLLHSQDGTELSVIQQTIQWLDRYFKGEHIDSSSIPMNPIGTDFQQEVWEQLRSIPYGCTVTYGQIARQIAANRDIPSMSSQAVGQAVGRNPISILVPCHRVVGTGGRLTGYDGGIPKKEFLLRLEGVL